MLGMSRLSPSKWIFVTTCSVALTTVGVTNAQGPAAAAAPVATAPPFTPAPINGTLVDFMTGLPVSHTMQVMAQPKLMRPGFAGEPVNTAKGLASKIKAKEVDVPKRVKAAKYLGKVDCQAFPDSQKQLLDLVVNDEFEEVRLAAAKAFKEQFSKGCNQNPSKKKQRRYDTCRGCCNNVEVLNKLAERAYECDDTGCAKEPSPRVREAIAEALNVCCCWQYHGGAANYEQQSIELSPPPADVAPPTEAPKVAPPSVPPEAAAAAAKEQTKAINATHVSENSANTDVRPAAMTKTLPEIELEGESPADAESQADLPLVECLRGHCPVGMVERRLEKASAEFAKNYKGQRYEFASAEALEQFQRDPEHYAPACNGHCLMTLAKTQEKVVGKFCTEYDGRQYWFATKELREEFKADPEHILDEMDNDIIGDE